LRAGAIALALFGLCDGGPAFADPLGTWLTENGRSRIKIENCGGRCALSVLAASVSPCFVVTPRSVARQSRLRSAASPQKACALSRAHQSSATDIRGMPTGVFDFWRHCWVLRALREYG
jgi:hypothetical protein